jgi:hypothetical protein
MRDYLMSTREGRYVLPGQYFEESELLWYVNHVLEQSHTTLRVHALEAQSTYDMRFSATTSQGKKTAAIIEYQWHRSEGVLQIAKLWKTHNPDQPYDYARSGKPEKNLMLMKGWAFNAPVLTPAREKVVENIGRREFRHDHEGKIRASVLGQAAANMDYDNVATIAAKAYAEPKRIIALFEPKLTAEPSVDAGYRP